MTEDPKQQDPDETPLTSGDPLGSAGEAPGGDAPPPPGGPEQPTGGATPPPEPAPRRLTRSSSDKVIGGVAGGLGRYFGIDPILFRIAFVVLTFAGGVGVLAYIGLLAFVPADDNSRPFGGGSRAGSVAAAIVLGIALIVFIAPPVFFLTPVLLPVAVLVLIGIAIWRAAGGAPTGGDPARVVLRVVIAFLIGVAALAAFIAVGFAAALGGGTAIAILAVVAGVVLIAAAFLGGARWLIAPALVLVLPLAIVAAADLDLDGGVGDRAYRPTSVSELRDNYKLGIGQLVVDLRDVDLPAGRTPVNVDVGMGEAIVLVPDNACVSSDVQVGVGHSQVLGHDNDGIDVAFADAGSTAGSPEVHVDANVGVGELQVRRGNDLADVGRYFGRDFGHDFESDVAAQPACP
jgi:phage shock protein PspC (stress-responsive transcriptional regulator)